MSLKVGVSADLIEEVVRRWHDLVGLGQSDAAYPSVRENPAEAQKILKKLHRFYPDKFGEMARVVREVIPAKIIEQVVEKGE